MSEIYISRKIPDNGLKLLEEKGIKYYIGSNKKSLNQSSFIKNLKKRKYDGVISFLTDTIDKKVFDACPTAKIFANYSVGFNNIDLDEAKKRNIKITNTPGTSSVAVAEHTVALMIALTTRLVEGDKFIRQGKYKGWDPDLLLGTDLKGKIIGLIGGGQIGSEVAKILHRGFGTKVIYSDIAPNLQLEEIIGPNKVKLEQLLKESDIISLHVPLLPTTTHLIDRDKLSMMKNSALLINTSRGPVVDEKALVDALKNKIIAGAGLDVFEFEPKLVRGLSKLNNVVLTPHIASSRFSARSMMAEIAVKNVISVLENGQPINNVY